MQVHLSSDKLQVHCRRNCQRRTITQGVLQGRKHGGCLIKVKIKLIGHDVRPKRGS